MHTALLQRKLQILYREWGLWAYREQCEQLLQVMCVRIYFCIEIDRSGYSLVHVNLNIMAYEFKVLLDFFMKYTYCFNKTVDEFL